MTAPTQAQIDAAVSQEYRVEAPTESMRHWVPDADYSFQIRGPVAVEVEAETRAFDLDSPLSLSVTVGTLRLRLDWDGAEALAFSLLQELYGQQWIRVLMALCARCPVDFENLRFDGTGDGVPDEAVQALWAAAFSYRDLWPDRQTGFNDHIWGVAAPAGVTPIYPHPAEGDES